MANFKLLEQIGEGGTATVYRAEHGELGACAVKILKPKMRSDPTAVKRFLREAGYGSRVKNPGVVTTHEYGEADGFYYLALEWADGEPLSDYISSQGRLSLDTTVEVAVQLADALTAAHAEGIIHRDLKPENIMYHPSSGVAKLLDFGIARDAQQDASERLTRTGFFVGTLQYVAPETLSGELVGESADIYSLAKITYYMLTGVLPHSGRSPRELFQQLLTQPPTPLNEAVKNLRFPEAVEEAVMKGLATKPEDRPPTVKAFAEGLRDAARNSHGQSVRSESGLFGALKSLMSKKKN